MRFCFFSQTSLTYITKSPVQTFLPQHLEYFFSFEDFMLSFILDHPPHHPVMWILCILVWKAKSIGDTGVCGNRIRAFKAAMFCALVLEKRKERERVSQSWYFSFLVMVSALATWMKVYEINKLTSLNRSMGRIKGEDTVKEETF